MCANSIYTCVLALQVVPQCLKWLTSKRPGVEVPGASVAFVHCSRSVCNLYIAADHCGSRGFLALPQFCHFFPSRNKCAIIILGQELPNDQKFNIVIMQVLRWNWSFQYIFCPRRLVCVPTGKRD